MIRKRYILILIVVGALVWFIVFLRRVANEGQRALNNDSFVSSNTISAEYRGLFRYPSKLEVLGSNKSQWRAPITDISYEGKFFIEIYKIDSMQNQLLSSFIKESNIQEHISYNQYYNAVMDNKPNVLSVSYRSGKPDIVNMICLNIDGDNTHIIDGNDSLYYYSSNFRTLSLSYNKQTVQDIFIKSGDKDENEPIPLQLMFTKRKNNLYVLLMTPIDKKTIMPADVLKKALIK